jgi:hypothetical protein
MSTETVVVMECVFCKARKEVGPQKDHPMCEKCYGPMATVKAVTRKVKQ